MSDTPQPSEAPKVIEAPQSKGLVVPIVIAAVVALAVGLIAGRLIFGAKASTQKTAGATVAGTKIDVITKATQSDFWQSMLAGSKDAGVDLGIDIKLTGPTAETDIDKQVAMVEDSITRKVQAIVLAANSSTALNSVIDRARAAGIKVITVDNAVSTTTDGFIGTDNLKAGSKAGERLCKLITDLGKPDGKVLHESGASGQQVLVDRFDGFKAGFTAGCPNATILATQVNDNDLNKAVSQVTDAINANPDLVGVFADNNTSGTGAARAVAAISGSKVQVVGFDADPAEVDAIKAGTLQAIVVQNPYFFGYQGVVEAAMAVAGRQPPTNLDPGAVVVDAKNVADPALQSVVNPPR